MTILVFEHEGWHVATSAWSVGGKPNKKITICYEWGPDGFSWFSNAVSTRQVTFNWTIEDFLAAIKGRDILDLRPA